MDMETQGLISKMVTAMERMAKSEFAELPLSNLPFEISFPLEDDNPDQAQSVCEGLQLGLSKVFWPSPVSAIIQGAHYKVRIDR